MHYIAQERKTKLPANIVAKVLQEEESHGMLNEAGVIYLSTGNAKERQEMEELLLRSLWSSDQGARYICYCHLQRANGTASQEAHDEIGLFRKDRRNIHLIECAKSMRWL